MSKRVTMRDIAEAAGVSAATVSHILNERGVNYCSEETREKVRRVAAELGYRKNIGYQLMHSMRTRTVGLMVASDNMLEEEHYRLMVLRLIQEFESRNYAVFCHIMPNNDEAVSAEIADFISRGVEHFAFIGCPSGYQRIIREMNRVGVSAVFTREAADRFVASDVTSAMEEIFRNIIDKCRENFKLVCSRSWSVSPINNRINALMRIFPERSREEIIETFVFPIPEPRGGGDFAEELFQLGRQATLELLRRNPELGGIVYLNDLLAWGGGSLLLEESHRGFRKIALAGCNYERVMRHFPLPYSTVEFNLEKLVPLIADAALDNAECRIFVPPILHLS